MDAMGNNLGLPRAGISASFLAALVVTCFLSACSGSTGPAGPAGPGGSTPPPVTPPSTGGATDVTKATGIVGTISSVTVSGPPVVKFSVADPSGAPLKGLTASSISFAVAQLVPGLNGTASQWNSYLFKTANATACPPGVASCAPPAPATQATTEAATSGTLVDNGDGTYQYTFMADITKVASVPYNAALTHRVAFQISGLAQANNGAFTFQPSTGATTGIFSREIVETATCNNCHTSLSAHGGSRVEVQYCVMCHNPGTTDPESGSTVDMKVMIHKIHTGINLPTIQAAGGDTTPTYGIGYWIIGFKNSVNNFNTVLYPQDTRNCLTCHVQGIPTLPDAANYNTVPTVAACGSCHDTVNFATGANHAGGVANDSQCTNCHKATGGLSAASKHVIPEIAAAADFQFIVNSVSSVVSAGLTYPVIKFSVLNPNSGNAPYNILTDAPFVGVDPGTGKPVCASGGAAKLAFKIAWDSRDYTNWGTGNTSDVWGEPISLNPLVGPGCAAGVPPSALTGPDAAGVFTLTSPTALPPPPPSTVKCPPAGPAACPAVSNIGVTMEGRTGVVTTGPGASKIPVTSTVGFGNVSGGAPVARRTVVDSGKCNACHGLISEHGGSRNGNVQICTVCHNPASTDVGDRLTLGPTTPEIDGLWEQTIDFKYMIHAIHDGSVRGAAGSPYLIGSTDFTSVVFPGQINRCDMCHVPSGYYPVDTTAVQSTTLLTGFSTQMPNPTTPGNPIATSANMSVCSSCHVDAAAQSHMAQNGGSTIVRKDAEGRTIPPANPANSETCSLCHGPGGVADVRVVHNVPAGN